MEGVSKRQLRSSLMLPSSSRLSPLAKPFSLKRDHDHDRDHGQHVRRYASNPSEWDGMTMDMSYSGFSGLPLIPSLDLDNYLKKERNNKDDGIRSQSCEKGSVSAQLIGPQPYSSVVSRILDEYGTDRALEESYQFGGFHPSDSGNGWCLQKDDNNFYCQEGFPFIGKDASNSPALHVDMKKALSRHISVPRHRASNDSKLLDETCNSISTDSQMKFKGAEHEQEDAKLAGRESDVSFPFENLVARDWEHTATTKGTSFNAFGGRTPALSIDHDCESSVSCQSWKKRLKELKASKILPCSRSHDEIENSDSDVDSPCWKGFHQSQSRASGALDAQNPETKPVTKNSLNPLAPQFFPQNAKSWSIYEDNKLVPEDPFSFLGTSSVAPPVVLPETHNFEEDFCSPLKYSPFLSPAHYDMSDHGNKPLQKGDEKFDFFFDHLLTKENYFRLIEDLEMQTGSVRQENDMPGSAVKKAISVPLLAAPSTSGTLTQQKNSVSVLSEPSLISNTPFGASAAINMSLNIDEEVLVHTMYDLSKLLLTKCHGGRSFDKLNHERIQAVIDNLLLCMEGGHAKRESMPELANLCILDNPPWKYADALTNTNSTILRKIPREMCGSSGAVNRTQQSSEKTPGAICFDEAKISPQAQLYRLLWLEAQSELLYLKSKHPPCA